MRTQVFIAHSTHDAEWLERLKTMLAPLVRVGLSCWDDQAARWQAPASAFAAMIDGPLDPASAAVMSIQEDMPLAPPCSVNCGEQAIEGSIAG